MTPKQIAAIDRAVKREQMRALREEVKEAERRAWVRAHPAQAMKNLKRRLATRRRNLLDPNYGTEEKKFPTWLPGMSAQQYIRIFQTANRSAFTGDCELEFIAP